MRPERPGRGRLSGVVVGLWSAAVILLVMTVFLVAVHLAEIRTALALDVARDEPSAGADEVVRAVNIALVAGAVLAAVAIVAAVYGCLGVWHGRRSGRGWLVVAVLAAVVLTVGGAVVIGPSASAVTDAGLPPLFHWIVPAVACVLGAIATVLAYRSMSRRT
ncbi:hypothetical protein D7316_02942 [Gordonia insulae]|uniref:Uncharacterized protein n=2 Tax=Gordonia insulae TaxID=2420509 RepID=A0A3G8JMM7_9ACTN|nr:hypothetical protein D7316_02942 [Gordonia insulae]